MWPAFNARAASSLLAEQDSVTIAGAVAAALPRRKTRPVPVAIHGLARGRQVTVRVRRNVPTGPAEGPFPAVRHIAATARRLAEQRAVAIPSAIGAAFTVRQARPAPRAIRGLAGRPQRSGRIDRDIAAGIQERTGPSANAAAAGTCTRARRLAEQVPVAVAGPLAGTILCLQVAALVGSVVLATGGLQLAVLVDRGVATGIQERSAPLAHVTAVADAGIIRLAEQRPIAIAERPAGPDRRRGELVLAAVSPALGVQRPVLDVRSFATLAPRSIREAVIGSPCRLR